MSERKSAGRMKPGKMHGGDRQKLGKEYLNEVEDPLNVWLSSFCHSYLLWSVESSISRLLSLRLFSQTARAAQRFVHSLLAQVISGKANSPIDSQSQICLLSPPSSRCVWPIIQTIDVTSQSPRGWWGMSELLLSWRRTFVPRISHTSVQEEFVPPLKMALKEKCTKEVWWPPT